MVAGDACHRLTFRSRVLLCLPVVCSALAGAVPAEAAPIEVAKALNAQPRIEARAHLRAWPFAVPQFMFRMLGQHSMVVGDERAHGVAATTLSSSTLFGLAGAVEDEDIRTGTTGSAESDTIVIASATDTQADSEADGFDISLSLNGSAGGDVSVTSTATATGVNGMEGDDTIIINAVLSAGASADANVNSMTLNVFDNASANGAVTGTATAYGVRGGEGNDTITVGAAGEVHASAVSTAEGGPFDITLVDVLGGNVDTTVTANATAVAIDGGVGKDTITNDGAVSAATSPFIMGDTTNISIVGNPAFETARAINSTATGIDGGLNADTITNNGTVTSIAGGFIAVTDNAFGLGASDISSADAPVTGMFIATGIDGGGGHDSIVNDGTIDVDAGGDVSTGTQIASLVSIDPFESEAIVDGSVASIAVATGIAGGNGNDVIQNHGTITADATPTVTSLEFDFAVVGTISATAANRADGTAIGIDGGAGNDTILNTEAITATATTHAHVDAISSALSLVPLPTGLLFTTVDALAISSANAIGIEGGDGDDAITNEGTITANATATMTSVGVIVKIGLSNGTGTGDGGGGSALSAVQGTSGGDDALSQTGAVDASTVRQSNAAGLSGGAGSDVITNSGTIDVATDASAIEVTVDASIAFEVGGGLAIGGGSTQAAAGIQPEVADAGTIARSIVGSEALGIDGGAGADTIVNDGAVNATALASSSDVGVKANISIPADPVGLFDLAGGVDAQSFTESLAAGLAGGSGADVLRNEDVVTVLADSDSLGFGIEINTQVVLGTQAMRTADVSALTAANAYGMHGDDPRDAESGGNDVLVNSGTLDVTADATASATTATVVLGGFSEGHASTEVETFAVGMHGGAGSDSLWNTGDIIAAATSNGSSTAVEISALTFATLASAESTASASASGMHGGAGDDTILHEGTIDVNATATVDVDSVAVTVITDTSTTESADTGAEATAAGLRGGTGSDNITWTGSITAAATSDATSGTVNIDVIGGTLHTAGLTSTARAVGADGGSGNDVLNALGAITATAHASAGASSFGLDVTGPTVANVTTDVTANATGVDGGSGQDSITIQEMITASATAETSASGVAIALIGEGQQSGGVMIAANAFGARGDDDADTIINDSTIDVDAASTGHAGNVNVSLIGAAHGDASLVVTAEATGLAGDAGQDVVVNKGTILATATGTGTLSNFDFSLVGVASVQLGDASTTVNPVAAGMTGGAGSDMLRNEGVIDADATATLTTQTNAAIDIIGEAGVSAIVASSPTASGIVGGAGNDTIWNLVGGDIDVTSSATFDLLSGTSFSFIGAASDQAEVTSAAHAFGLSGRGGDDMIQNDGDITVTATSTMDIDSDSTVAIGASHTNAQTNAAANAVGLAGGNGDNWLLNTGLVEVTSNATTTSNHSSYTFAGDPTTNAVLESNSHAFGVQTGDGDDWIRNDGTVDVVANATMTATGGARATFDFGTVEATAVVGSTAEAIGIDSGAGDDTIINSDVIAVRIENKTAATNNSNAGFLFGDAGADTSAAASLTATGIAAGDGDDQVLNTGSIDVTVNDTTGPLTVNATSNSNGGDFTIDGDARSTSSADLLSALTGIDGGAGDNTIVNEGEITVTNKPTVAALSKADGDGLDGDGWGTTSVGVGKFDSPVSAIGIAVGDGNNSIQNSGTLTITSAPVGDSDVSIDGDNTGVATGVTATTVRSLAVGIAAGDGANVILNDGMIDVTASANGDATSVVEPGWLVNGSGFEIGDAAAVSNAFGIRAGDGGNHIWNTGTIDVSAVSIATGTTFETAHADATGILTGSGNDVIVNAGSGVILTSISENGASGAGIAINAGAGNDRVRLIDQSAVFDDILLGDGNDVISFAGSASMTGVVYGGDGSDALRIEDQRTLAIDPADFDSIERLHVDQGTLLVGNDYTFAEKGALRVDLFDGGNGELVIDGMLDLGESTTLIVSSSRTLLANGESFTIASADAVESVFADERLPESFFVAFDVGYEPDRVTVAASVQPFATAASNPVQDSVSAYLDQIAAGATGDLAAVLGELQMLSDPDAIDAALSSLSSEMAHASALASVGAARSQQTMLGRRMRVLRATVTAPSPAGDLQGAGPVVALGAIGSNDAEAQFGLWTSGLGQWGSEDAEAGFSGFYFSTAGVMAGFDALVTPNLLAGVSFGYTTTDIDLDAAAGGSGIESYVFTAYGSFFAESVWLDGSFSYGRQRFDDSRRVMVGDILRTAHSDHDADLLAAALTGGLRFGLGEGWHIDPFAGLEFFHLDEDGYTETGADDVNLTVAGRSIDALLAELGVRLAADIRSGNVTWTPQVSAAWVHDFNIDGRRIVAGFTGAPGTSFAIEGPEQDDFLRVEAGFGVQSGVWGASVQYLGEFSSRREVHGVMGTIGFRF